MMAGRAPQATKAESTAAELHRQHPPSKIGRRQRGVERSQADVCPIIGRPLHAGAGVWRFPNGTDGRLPVQALFGRGLLPVHRMLPPPHRRSGRICPVQGHRQGLGMAAIKPQGNGGGVSSSHPSRNRPLTKSSKINPEKSAPPSACRALPNFVADPRYRWLDSMCFHAPGSV